MPLRDCVSHLYSTRDFAIFNLGLIFPELPEKYNSEWKRRILSKKLKADSKLKIPKADDIKVGFTIQFPQPDDHENHIPGEVNMFYHIK